MTIALSDSFSAALATSTLIAIVHDDLMTGAPPPPPRRLPVVRAPVSPEDEERPHTRGECSKVPRPCPYVGCVYHLLVEVKENRSLEEDDPLTLDPAWSCALDVADRGAQRREDIARALDVVPERIRQIAFKAIAKLREQADDDTRALFEQMESIVTETQGDLAQANGEDAGQRWADDPHSWRRGDSIYRGVDEAEARDEAEAWANEVVSLVRTGLSLRDAMARANEQAALAPKVGYVASPAPASVPPNEASPAPAPVVERPPRPTATVAKGEAPAIPEETAALIAERQAVRAKLRARLVEVQREIALIEAELAPRRSA